MEGKIATERLKKVLVASLVALVTAAFFFPIFWWFISSLKPFGSIFHIPPIFFFTPTTTWYEVVLLNHSYQTVELAKTGAITGEGGGLYYSIPYLRDSTIIALTSTFLVTIVSCFAGYALSRFNFRRRKDLIFWILSTRMMPPVVVALPLFLMYQKFGLIDTYAGIILVHTVMNLPLSTLLLKSFFDEVPRDLDEAAMVDGASRLQAFWKVIVYYVRPGLAATAILSFIFSWNEFLFALMLTAGKVRTVPVAAATFITAYGTEWGFLAALGTAAIVPIFIFTLFAQRHLVRGLTMGAVRG